MALEANAHRKTLFRTPAQVPSAVAGTSERASDAIEALLTKSHFEQEIESSYKLLKSDSQDQRMKKLRQHLDTLAHDDWKYPTVESLIGFK